MLPKPIYESLPFIYMAAGAVAIVSLDHLLGRICGFLLILVGIGVYQMRRRYRYRKIGIRCHLHNDVFHLEGTARPETTTYLIDGGWLPPRLDVIVSTPTISFKEMVKRLKRIERTGD